MAPPPEFAQTRAGVNGTKPYFNSPLRPTTIR